MNLLKRVRYTLNAAKYAWENYNDDKFWADEFNLWYLKNKSNPKIYGVSSQGDVMPEDYELATSGDTIIDFYSRKIKQK